MFDRTIALSVKILNDTKKILKISNLVFQVICMAFCSYSIYQHAKNGSASLIPYIILLGLSLLYFVVSVMTYFRKTGVDRKSIHHAVSMLKIVCRLVLIGFAIFDMCTKEVSQSHIIVTVGMLILVLLEVLLEIFAFALAHYVTMVKYAVTQDSKEVMKMYDDFMEDHRMIAKFVDKQKAAALENSKPRDDGELPEDKSLREVELLARDRQEKRRQAQLEKIRLKEEEEVKAKEEKKDRKREKRKTRKEKFKAVFHRHRKNRDD